MSLADAILRTAGRTGGSDAARGIAFLDRRGRVGEHRRYADLARSWSAAAGRLAVAGGHERRLVFVCLPASWEFFDAWFGALLAGAWPVAVAPPLVLGAARHQFTILAKLVERFDPRHVIAADSTRDRAREHGLTDLADRIITPQEFAGMPAAEIKPPAVDAGDPAFLQFTSGSTGIPRAVVISNRAVLATVAAIADAAPAPSAGHATVVTWLPLHHDMGLVGCLLFGLVNGHDVHFLSQRTFLGRPATWLRALGDAPHVFTAAPNFAYQACVERADPAELADVDLSDWRVAVTGAEMIRPETVAAFAERFGPLGFRPETFVAAYGMAETTLTITMDRAGGGVHTRVAPAGDDGAERDVCSVGTPVSGMDVRVVGSDGDAVSDGVVGEVWTRGDGLFDGYHDDPDATDTCFRDGWFDTGDLGMLADGELWLTGRRKDLIIVNGQNVMPHEIEWLAESVTGVGGACRAGAFAVAEGASESAVVVLEIDPATVSSPADLAREVRVEVGRESGLPLADVLLVRRGTIPRTSSGKVRRAELGQMYRDGALERLDTPDAG